MTVPEVAVVTFILSIVVAVMFSFLDQVTTLSARTDRQAEAEGAAQLALRTATQNIRGALPVAPCTSDGGNPSLPTSYADCVKVRVSRSTSGVGGCPHTQYVYAIVNYSGVKKLVENREEIACDGTVSNVRLRRVLLDNLVNAGAGEPLFTYYRGNGTAIPVTDLAAVPKASSVRMLLKVKYARNAPPLSFASVIAPRNNR
jgi:type II secretory pathway component PulJ